MRYLLDTHVLVWWLTSSCRLSPRYRRTIRNAEKRGEAIAVATISLWEIARLVERGRIKLPHPVVDALDAIARAPLLRLVGIDAQMAADSAALGAQFPRDPVDQIIAATARRHSLILLTEDERIRDSGAVRVL